MNDIFEQNNFLNPEWKFKLKLIGDYNEFKNDNGYNYIMSHYLISTHECIYDLQFKNIFNVFKEKISIKQFNKNDFLEETSRMENPFCFTNRHLKEIHKLDEEKFLKDKQSLLNLAEKLNVQTNDGTNFSNVELLYDSTFSRIGDMPIDIFLSECLLISRKNEAIISILPIDEDNEIYDNMDALKIILH